MTLRSRSVRIDRELEIKIKEFATKNNISLRQASREIAKICDEYKGKEVIRKLKF